MRSTLFPGRKRILAILTALALVVAACSSEDTEETPGSTDGNPAADQTTAPNEAGPEDDIDWSQAVINIVPVEVPDGYSVTPADDQGVTFNGEGYFLASSETEVVLFRLSDQGPVPTSVAYPPETSAKVFMTGTHLLVVAADPSGEMVVYTSSDGEAFEEARIPIPSRYVDADVWQATSILAAGGGAADLGESIYLIARIGVDWKRPIEVMSDYAATISPELGDAARYASTIRQAPQENGDTLFTFLSDGEIVFEALASEAGMEPGYQDAYKEALTQEDADTGETLSWIIDGSNATQTSNPPLDGGLDADMRLNDLYPVGQGVAALVTDFGGGAEAQAGRLARVGVSLNLRSILASAHAPVTVGVHHTWDGEQWELSGETSGDPQAGETTLGFNVEEPFYGLVHNKNGEYIFAESEDGIDWEVPEYVVDISLPDGKLVTLTKIGDDVVMVFDDGQGEYRSFAVETDPESGESFVEEIDVIPSVIPQLAENQPPSFAKLLAAFDAAFESERSLGLFGDILFNPDLVNHGF